MKALKIFLVLGIFLVSTSFVSKELISKPRRQRHQKPLFRLELFSDELQLTEDQQTKIKELRLKTTKEAIEMRSKIKIAELELRHLLQSDNPEEGQIKTKIEEIGELKTNLRFVLVKSRLDVRNSLTAEQLEKVKSLKKEYFKKRFRRQGDFRGRKPLRPFDGDKKAIEPGGDFTPNRNDLEGEFLSI
ncbi:MAG: Spy/CpxP family protein refolding chaperone [bacterium]